MKKILLLITVLSLTSCGLFRKSVKSSNTSEHTDNTEFLTESNWHVKTDLQGESKVLSSEQNQVQKDVNEHTTVTADEIEVKPDGSVKAKGNAKLGQIKNDRSKLNINKSIDRSDRYIGHIETKTIEKELQKQESKSEIKNKQSQLEPKGSSFVWLALGGLVFVIGLIWFFRGK